MQAPGNPLSSLSPTTPIFIPVDAGVYAPIAVPAGSTIVTTEINL